MEESPEQVLARLARYTESLKRPSPSPIDGSPPPPRPPGLRARPAAPPPPVAPPSTPPAVARPSPPAPAPVVAAAATTASVADAPARDWRWSSDPARRLSTSALRATLLGQLLAAVACVGAVLAFVRFDRVVAFTIVAVMIAAGSIAVARRVPLALWWTFGALLGALLGLFS